MPPRKSDGPKEAVASPLESPASTSKPAPDTDMDKGNDREKDKDKSSEPAAASESKKESSKDGGPTTIEDLNLPKSIITRLAKGVLPPNTQIQANAVLAVSKSATVFISHLANAANERTLASGKKTIMPDDVFAALDEIEYGDFRELLEAEFKKFNEVQTTKRNTYRRKVAAAKKGVPFVDPNASMQSAASGDGAENTTTATFELSDLPNRSTATAGADAPRSVKKHKPNGPNDDSAMDVDVDATEEMDAETEPEAEEEEEEDDEEEEDEEEEDDEEDGDGEEGEKTQDALEEREGGDGPDEALDDGDDSD